MTTPVVPPSASAYARREVVHAGLRATAIVVAFFLFPLDRSWWITAVLFALLLLGLFPFTFRRFRRVMTSEHPVGAAISALLMTLVILIVTFSSIYYGWASHHPSSFNGLSTKLDAVYFEATMLSTVGFGDITATSQAARGVVTVNMLLNLIYIGTTIRLLTWAVQHRVAAAFTAGPITPEG